MNDVISAPQMSYTIRDGSGGLVIINLLEADLVRVRYYPTGTPDPAMARTWAVVDLDGNCPPEGHDRGAISTLRSGFATHQIRRTETFTELSTGALTVRIEQNPVRISWYSGGQPIAADHPMIPYSYDVDSGALTHTLNRALDDHYYGFGEKSGGLDKHGRLLRMRNADAFGYDAELSDPLYKHIPFYITLAQQPGSRMGQTHAYGLFYDTPYDCEFNMGSEIDNYYGDYRYFRAAGGHLDYYFMFGPSIEHVVELYTSLTGRAPLPPLWTLGYLGSAMRYTDAPNAQEMLAEFIVKCHENDIPCTGFHLSSGYSMSNEGKRYVFTWNRDRVPDPAKLAETFHRAGMRLAANIKPAMLTTHPRYKEAEAFFIRHATEDKPDLLPFWGGEGAHLDFTNPAAYAWWKANVKVQLLDVGIDSTWNDNNEFNIRHSKARCFGFGQSTPIAALRPIQTLLMVMASTEAQREHNPERRPWALTRAGYAGIQRYAVTWTGDNWSSWKTLRYNIPMGLGLALSGFACVGHDVGGFGGEPPDAELLVRWVQNGIFHPRFCIHSWRTDENENAPWMHPEVLPLVREALRFRQRLVPYFYTLLREASLTGHPVIRPTVYHFQNDPQTHTQSFEFMVGPSLLVASVIEPGATTREVYLPAGANWYDWYTGHYYAGGTRITLEAPLDRIPLLVREGSIIPTDAEGKRRVYVFPHQESATTISMEHYEDDGESLDYLRGEYRIIRLRAAVNNLQITLESNADVEWILPAGETRSVSMVRAE